MLIDSHAHLTSSGLYEEVDALLLKAKGAGVEKIVNIATDPDSLHKGLALSQKYPWVFNAAATTPHDVLKFGELHFEAIAKEVGRLQAVGETGLDYYYEHSPKELQQQFLIRYLTLARTHNLPVVIHCRDAFQDFFSILDQEGHSGGVLHCFTGNLEEAKGVLDRGFYLSLSGIATFKKSVVLHEVARYVPLDRLLIETDAPYLAPEPFRGKTNEPAFLKATATFLASLKGVSFEDLAYATAQNASALFRLPEQR